MPSWHKDSVPKYTGGSEVTYIIFDLVDMFIIF